MAEENKPKSDKSPAQESPKPSKAVWLAKTIASFIVLAAALAAAYLAVKYLTGSNFNLDFFLTGNKVSQLP